MPNVRQFVVRLDRPEQLFEADPISPTSSAYTEYTAQPAMDTVRDLLLMRLPPKDADVQIDVVLPPDQVRAGLDDELTAAVRRWVRVQNTIDVETTEAGGAVGRRLFLLGLLAECPSDQWLSTSALVEHLKNHHRSYLKQRKSLS